MATRITSEIKRKASQTVQFSPDRISRFGRAFNVGPHTGMTYDEMKKADKNLQYRGDFDDNSPGDRYTRHVWEKNADKFDDEKFAEKVAIKAGQIERSKNPEKALARATASYSSRGSKALTVG